MDETVVVYGKDALAFAPGSAPPQRDLPGLAEAAEGSRGNQGLPGRLPEVLTARPDEDLSFLQG